MRQKKIKSRLFLKISFSIIAILVFIAVLFLILRFSPFTDFDLFLQKQNSYVFIDKNGKYIAVTPVEDGIRRIFMPVDEIPGVVIDAFLTAEDSRFFSHFGVDFFSIIRASFQNISANRQVSGASTISMQLARIISPSKKRDIFAKIKDVWNAFRLERRLSKNQILELYLNNIPFGFGIEGVAAASIGFFDTELTSLSLEQICCLCVVPRRPTLYNPIENPEKCSQAAFNLATDKNFIELLSSDGRKISVGVDEQSSKPETDLFFTNSNTFIENITLDTEIVLLQENFFEAATTAKRKIWPFYAPHLIQSLMYGKLPDSNKISWKQKNQLSIDLDLQQFCQYNLQSELQLQTSSRINNGAVIVIENSTGHILAWIGSNDWNDNIHNGQIDGLLVPNQMGSSMKPFLYAATLETQMLKPTSVLKDVPLEFGGTNIYIPLNFSNRFSGPVLFRSSLASSLNVPAVDILSDLTCITYLNFLERLGFESITGKNINKGITADLGLALGACEVTLAELACAFSVFPRDGHFLPISFFSTSKNEIPDENQSNRIETKNYRVFSADVARILCDILSDKSARVSGFGYSQTFETKYPSIFKTGTANQYQNIVALGATPDFTVGVWMGNFSGNTVIGKTGSSLPAYLGRKILDYLIENEKTEISTFLQPDNYEKVPICALSGKSPTKFCTSIVMEYVKKKEANEFSKDLCDWHKISSVTEYPAVYQQWFRDSIKNGIVNFASDPLTIISPKNNSIFYVNNKNQNTQKIHVEVIGGNGNSLVVFYDGKRLSSNVITRPFAFSLPVEQGNHIIEVVLGDERQSISYSVF